ncbi:MAG TPA: CHAT domain-containing protein [Allocoleopsis sp.]
MTQEFHLSVTPVGSDEYLIRTERVAPGVPLTEEQVIWTVEDWLIQARQLMNDPIIGLLQGIAINPFEMQLPGVLDPELTQPPLSLVELGQQLYSALFQGKLRDSWVIAQGIAQNRNEVLRLRLGLKGSRLPRLPWEVLYDTDTAAQRSSHSGGMAVAPRPLATGTHVIFSRFQPGTRLAPARSAPIDPNQPLQVLMVIAAPSDRERLELEREAHQLQRELHTQVGRMGDRLAGSPPDIELTILNQPGREQLTDALEQGCYQVLHYAGHSDLGAAGGSLYLVNNQTGLTEILSGDDLAGLLVNNGIRLAVFNSCRGAYTAAADPSVENERNLAEALVGRGIPAVLAMAEQIPDNVALTLTWLFYRNLKLGYPIDLSLSRARQGLLSAYGSQQLYWALPILYLHPEFDGYLTEGDRTTENPADQLILLPQGYSALPVLASEEVVAPLSALTSAIDASSTSSASGASSERSGSGEDSADWAAEMADLDAADLDAADLDATDLEAPDEEDAEMVADLLRQLSPSSGTPSSSSSMPPVDRVPAPQPRRSGSVPPRHSSMRDSARDSVTRDSATRDSAAREEIPAPTPVISTPVASSTSAIIPTQVEPTVTAEPARRRSVLPVLGVVSAVAVALVGIWSWAQLEHGIVVPLPGNSSILLGGAKDLQQADVNEVKQIAIHQFQRGRLQAGEQAVTALLDRNALPEAAAALQAVPPDVETAAIDFLWGRLAWQGLETGNSIYKLEDARSYWEKAAEADPNNSLYHEALGFAYYAENRPSLALQSWSQALSLLEQPPIAQQTSAASDNTQSTNTQSTDTQSTNTPENSESPASTTQTSDPQHHLLNTYAGIALGLWKSSNSAFSPAQENLTQKAAKIYQMVEQQDPNSFKPQVLSRNWLWHQEAIRDWQVLSQIQE